MTGWEDLQKKSDPQEIKAGLDIVQVCLHLGIQFVQYGLEFRALCPWHDDDEPSLHAFMGDDGFERIGCFPCGFTGDVFDVIRKVRGGSFGEALAYAGNLLDQGVAVSSGTSSVVVLGGSAATPTFDFVAYASESQALAGVDQGPILSLLADKGCAISPEWIRSEFGVGRNERAEVVIPHWDRAGSVLGIKFRALIGDEWTKKNARGSRLTSLYGAWRDKGQRTVILTEGETDTWTAAWTVKEDRDALVLGLPTGAGKPPLEDWIESLRDRDVVILFDADEAGRSAARRWWIEARKVASSVRVARLPEGQDATLAGTEAVALAISIAEDAPLRPPALYARDDGYHRPGKEETVPVTDWTVEVRRVIEFEDEEIVWEVEFRASGGRKATITSRNLRNVQAITDWSNARGLAWTGRMTDAQELLRHLRASSLFVPRVRGTRLAGWHEGGFVLPEENIGTQSFAYLPPVADVRLGEKLRLKRAPYDAKLPVLLARLHRPDVITPILGWVAAAPLRAIMVNFPTLAVVGGSGWGKTTLVREVLDAFGFASSPVTLTASTPHAVMSSVAATNAVPTWFDEYRPGARQDSKMALDQAIRDAWDSSASMKGGLSSNLQAITFLPASAPIVVTGEDAFEETSHAERMVIVPIPKDGRNAEVLVALRSLDRTGFGRAYLSWLVHAYGSDTIPAPPVLPDRMAQSAAVPKWGYDLLQQFTREVCGYELPGYDESLVLREQKEAAQTSPILEAMKAAYAKLWEGTPIVWQDGEDLCVKQTELCAWAKKNDFTLPGGRKAVGKWLKERFPGSENQKDTVYGNYLRVRGAVGTFV